MKPLFVSIPHSGEKVPTECTWLQNLPEPILMCDVDRFVDRLYEPILQELGLPTLKTEWHRYAGDLNRLPEDVDRDSVYGHANPSGMHSRGFHWVITTTGQKLMTQPMSLQLHEKMIQLISDPFHKSVRNQYAFFKNQGFQQVFHIDLHSMPGVGTKEHRDPGQTRADVVVSDCKGKSCHAAFKDIVIKAYESAGFQVAYNWPYFGGRVSELYGNPEQGQQTLQVELNRSLYMDEVSKQWKPELAAVTMKKLAQALREIEKTELVLS